MDQHAALGLSHQSSRPPNRRPFTQSWAILGCTGVFIYGLLTTLAWSDDAAQKGTSGVLLLNGNRIVAGRITPQGDTYQVEQAAGTLVLSKEQVTFVGENLRDVYVHLQDALPNPASADDHVDLARWCIGYKMIPEARFELEAALETEPGRDDIRRNLNQLDTLLRQPAQKSETAKSMTPAERMAKMAAGATLEVESLGGLSREAGQEFTRRIQPILIHNCMATACHGQMSENKFKLTLVRPGTVASRATTEKNLLALLPYIDREEPKSGQLWKLFKTNHGARGRSIFQGTRGQDQLKVCQDWLLSLSDATDEEQPAPVSSKGGSSKIQQVGHVAEQSAVKLKTGTASKETSVVPPPEPEVGSTDAPSKSRTAPRNATSRRGGPAKTTPRTATTADGPEVEPIVADERPADIPDLPADDPFNPDEFNRLQRVKRAVNP